jgi:hypothetical protein
MERRFNDSDFEKLLKENADQYRMYPSEKVWKGVHSALHRRHKWYGISAFTLLLLTTAGLTFFGLYDTPAKPTIAETKKTITETKTQIQSSGFLIADNNNQTANTIENGISNTEKKSITIPEPEKEIADLNSSVVSAENQKPGNTTQPQEVTEQSLNTENTNSEIQKLASNSDAIVIENEQANLSGGISEEKLNADARLKVDISALASQNVPVIIPKKQPRLTAQIYFTPTFSYRKLSENTSANSGGSNSYLSLIGVNNLVKHKPLMGLEFGIESKYRLKNWLFFKSGLQFNINRYDISAYSHPTEIATVSVNNGYRTFNYSAPSNYGNFSGSKQNWLENFYFQVAVPLGAEIILTEKKNYSWGISGTIQPTYVIGDRAYLISSDFRNYAKFPDLMRRWNLSSGAETFISYSTGRIRWQTGPHIRYQHLSSFVSEYPVKENLFAVGLKIAATLNYKK